MRTMLILLLLLLLPEIAVKNTFASGGDLDPTFASAGKTRVGFGGGNDIPGAIYSLSNGGFLTAGSTGDAGQAEMCLARYLSNGSSDPTFGDGGVVRLPVDPFPSAGAMAVTGGTIIVAGTIDNTPAAARFLDTGAPDPSFGTDGVVKLTGAPRGWVTGLVLQGSRIVLAANLWNGSQYHFGLIRLNDNGTLDPTFDGDGFVITPILQSSTANAITQQVDGKIVLAGYARDLSFRYAAVVARYDANGVPDPTFDADGKVITYAGSSDSFLHAVALQSTKLVVVGHYGPTGTRNGLVIRYNSNGTLDATFGPQSGTGIVIQPVGGGEDTFRAVKVMNSSRGSPSRIFVAGGTNATPTGSRSDIVVCQYLLTGALDTAFDGDGIIVTSTSSSDDRAVCLLQPDSKIVVGGYSGLSYQSDFVFLRYSSTSGVLDTTFDGDGIRVHDIGHTDTAALAIAMQPDGRIVLGGYIGYPVYDMAVARLNVDGSLDAGFSGDGRVLIPFTDKAAVSDMVLQPDGRILLAGLLGSGLNPYLGLARLLPDGSPDPAFGALGTGTISTIDNQNPHALGLQNSGAIIVAGDTKITGGQDGIRVSRFSPDGVQDYSFGVQGRYNSSLGGSAAYARDVALQPDDAIIVVGHYVPANQPGKAVILRLTPSGSLDLAFGTGGFETADVGPGEEVATQVAIQPDGRIVVAGYSAESDGDRSPFVLRYDSQGHLDSTFDGDGSLIPDGTLSRAFYGLGLEPDGRILLAGSITSTPNGSDQYVMRLLPSGSVDPSFGPGGGQYIDYNNSGDAAEAITSSPDGQILVAGIGAYAMSVARLEGGPALTGVAEQPETDHPLFVGHPWPNPSHQGATIEYDFKTAATGTAEVFDTTGRLVRRLARFASTSGPGHLIWDGLDDTGSLTESGVYFIRVTAGDRVERRRVVVMH